MEIGKLKGHHRTDSMLCTLIQYIVGTGVLTRYSSLLKDQMTNAHVAPSMASLIYVTLVCIVWVIY